MAYLFLLLLFLFLFILAKSLGKRDVTQLILYYLNLFGFINKKNSQNEVLIKNMKMSLLILFSGTLLAFFLRVWESGNSVLKDNQFLFRKEAGEGSLSVDLIAKTKDGKKGDISIEIEEMAYSAEELEEMLWQLQKDMEGVILGENKDFEKIYTNLNLPVYIKNYPFEMSYSFDTFGIFEDDGTYLYKEKEAKKLHLLVKAVYRDFTSEWEIPICVYPQTEELSFEEQVHKAVEQALNTGDRQICLPNKVAGESVTWEEKKEKSSLAVLGLSLGGVVLIWIGSKKEEKKKKKEKIYAMEEEYSTIIMKFVMYLSAGQNIKNTWEIIVEKRNANPIYEEMLYAKREMESGVRMEIALENFSSRIVSKRYVRFVTLLLQGQSKGNVMLLSQLREEERICLEEEKAQKKKKGEEANTKLLIPMTLMLVMVMLMIMFPAFLDI